MMNVIQIPRENAEALFPLAAPMLEKAIAYTRGSTSLPRVHGEVASGQKQLWFIKPDDGKSAPVAAGVTSLVLNDDGTKTANVELLGGAGLPKWFDLRSELEAWAKAEGCDSIKFHGRKEWARLLPDYKITHYVMRKELT